MDVLRSYRQLNQKIEEQGQAALVTQWLGRPKEAAKVEKRICENTQGMQLPEWEVTREGMRVTEYFSKKDRLILLGGGHISLALAEFAAKTGFLVTVVDDRPFFANSVRFSCASKILCKDYAHAIRELKITSLDYIVILTRGHRFDQVCMEELGWQELPHYLGMLGSRRRVSELKKVLLDEGVKEELIDMLNAPVGLDIGAKTPEEIAISIMAQLIEYRRKDRASHLDIKRSDVDLEILKILEDLPSVKENLPCALVTILETKGSTPRKAGAKMIVYSDGRLEGTIGGGCAEAEVAARARRLLGKNTYEVFQIDMTGNAQEEEAMLCGGWMKVFIESITGKDEEN